MLAPFKALFVAFGIIFVLLFSTGILAFEKQNYECLSGRELKLDKKVQLLNVGLLRVNAFPLRYDCDEAERYDPAILKVCGQELCKVTDDENPSNPHTQATR